MRTGAAHLQVWTGGQVHQTQRRVVNRRRGVIDAHLERPARADARDIQRDLSTDVRHQAARAQQEGARALGEIEESRSAAAEAEGHIGRRDLRRASVSASRELLEAEVPAQGLAQHGQLRVGRLERGLKGRAVEAHYHVAGALGNRDEFVD